MKRFEEETVEFKSKRRGTPVCWIIILAVATFVFLVLSIVFITLFALEKSKSTETSPKSPVSGQKYCGTRACLETSLETLKQLNQSADPCTDFYEYACGGWEDENALEPGETSVTGFSIIREKSFNVLKEALANAEKNYSDNEAVMKTVKFYNVCLDEASVNRRGDAPLKDLIDRMGGWNVTGNMTSLSTMNIVQRIGKITSELFIKPFIDVKVFYDPHDSSKHIIQLAPGQLGMNKAYYTKNSSDYWAVRDAYKTYMKKVAKLLGGGPDSDEQMMKVFELERQLAVLDKDAEASNIIETLKKYLPAGVATFELRTTLAKVSRLSKIDIKEIVELIDAVFARQGRKFRIDEKIVAWPPLYYIRLFDFYQNLTKHDPVVFVNYIMWTVIHKFIMVMPQEYQDAYNDYITVLLGNKTRHRWKECIGKMQSVFGMPLGLLFVDAAFDEQSKKTVTKMTRLMKDEFVKRLDTLTWMSDYSKAKAREKGLAIQESIGYPSYIKDPEKLAAKIKGLTVGDKLFENVVKTFTFTADEAHGSLDKPVDKEEWFMGPSVVNGYYASRQNRIVFLAAILQPPFYNPKAPSYLNYGGIGMVIGHEITHGFDSTGRLFDKDGNINSWFSRLTTLGYIQRQNCLAKQYSEFEVYGRKINGNLTINENIADNGGIKLAFEAYKTLVKNEGTEGALPGVGLNEDQLFFIGFARPWCSLYRKKAAYVQLETDNHSFPKYRIIGTLHNYKKFSEAFNCKPGSPMNPVKKCSLW